MKALRAGQRRLTPVAIPPNLFVLPFLCPAITSRTAFLPTEAQARCFTYFSKRYQEAVAPSTTKSIDSPPNSLRGPNDLPLICPGCGAFSQTVDTTQAGFYDLEGKAVKAYLRQLANGHEEADTVYKNALLHADQKALDQLGLKSVPILPDGSPTAQAPPPVCTRCHTLVHYRKGVSIHHPPLEALADTIAESPYKHNHIYHVLDAADFPLSLVPGLQKTLSLSRLRSQNRRGRADPHYKHGGTAELDFVITRSDLLAPKKEQVDGMMPALVEILRDALGREGRNVRLGNVRCVSVKRGWWTKEVKGSIWQRGGGGWMVGKVNVGKSNLFEAVFPKGRAGHTLDMNELRKNANREEGFEASPLRSGEPSPDALGPTSTESALNDGGLLDVAEKAQYLDVGSLLPPAPKEVPFPPMPLVSSLPGTTASPIRLPFGGGRGELIDLPGLDRDTLDTFVKADKRLDTVMISRVKPKRLTLKPGQSLLLDGLIRITPSRPDDIVFMTHCFVPLAPHVTATAKAQDIEAGERAHPLGDDAIADFEKIRASGNLQSAGKFKLRWDVTRAHAGPMTRKDAVGLRPDQLPWKTYAADILIAGCGWVEVVAEVRRRKIAPRVEATDDLPSDWPFSPAEHGLGSQGAQEDFPEVEVFAPEGRFVGVRRPLNAWLVGGAEAKPKKHGQQRRPRRSMSGFKARRQRVES